MLTNKKILVGITGCIGVYKICSLVNQLKKEGAEVRVVMTKAATEFVRPLTFQTLTNSEVYIETFDIHDKSVVEHIYLADWCDVLLIAPATANTIAKIAHGFGDNLLTTIALAIGEKTKKLVAPAMNCHMWENPITQHNISTLKENNYLIIGPEYGNLACGYSGQGKISDNKVLFEAIQKALS